MNRLDSSSVTPLQNADMRLVPGVVIGNVIADKYRIERVIGRGGMGLVVAAAHLALDRRVAIKLIRDEWGHDPMAVTRLLREAKAAASIQSEHVARVLDVGTLGDGAPFIVMEYLEGKDLDTLLREDGPLAATDAVDYILQACEALAEAHRNGIVHRDLKPANVFIARQPGGVACVKVVDFGISKVIGRGQNLEALTHPSHIVGTLYHMAPEQMCGEPVDARTDIWAIGALLFEMLTGRKPYREGFWPEVCAQVLSPSGPALSVANGAIQQELEAVIRKCMSRLANDRYQNVAELAVALVPFGKQGAHVSLERIVRLATATGSLAAEVCTPAPPSELLEPIPLRVAAGTSEPPGAAAPAAEESMVTRKPVSAPVVAARNGTALRLARAVTVLGALTIVVSSLSLLRGGAAPKHAETVLLPLEPQAPPKPADDVARVTPPGLAPPGGDGAGEPSIAALPDPPQQPIAADEVAAPTGGVVIGASVSGSDVPASSSTSGPRSPNPAAAGSTTGSGAVAGRRAAPAPLVAPAPPTVVPAQAPASSRTEANGKSSAAAEPPAVVNDIIRELPEGVPTAPPHAGGPEAEVPPEAAAPPGAGPSPAKPIDPWDLSGVGFKRKSREVP